MRRRYRGNFSLRIRAGRSLAVAASIALVCGIGASPANAADCPNADIRNQQGSGFLAECRAYEMVSPVDKNGVGLFAKYDLPNPYSQGGPAAGFALAADGSALAYTAAGALPGTEGLPGFAKFASRRSAAGWSLIPLDPPSRSEPSGLRPTQTFAVSADLTRALVYTNENLGAGGVSGQGNLYVREVGTDNYTLVATHPKLERWSDNGGSFNLLQTTPSLSVIQFRSQAKLTPDAPSEAGIEGNVFEWREGEGLSVLAVGSSGEPLPQGGYQATPNGSVKPASLSVDGTRSLFHPNDPFGFKQYEGLYLKEGDEVIQVSASQRPGDDPTQPQYAYLAGTSRDLSVIYFASPAELTEVSNNGPEAAIYAMAEATLYRYDVASGELTDLLAGIPPAERQLKLSGNSESIATANGSTLYFVALGGKLLAWRDGEIDVVGPLQNEAFRTYRAAISPNGRFLTYESRESMTSYPSVGPACAIFEGKCSQIYLYDAATEHLRCVSCSPTGAPPAGAANFTVMQSFGFSTVESGSVTDSGMVAFETQDALAPRDVNGRRDVYIWRDGTVDLLSSGQGENDAILTGTSEDGSTVAFETANKLVGADTDDLVDAYVARVDGGFAFQNRTVAPRPECEGSACQDISPTPPPAPRISSRPYAAGAKARKGRFSSLRTPDRIKALGESARLRVDARTSGILVVTGPQIVRVVAQAGRPGPVTIRIDLRGDARRRLSRQGRVEASVRVLLRSRGKVVGAKQVRVVFHQHGKGWRG